MTVRKKLLALAVSAACTGPAWAADDDRARVEMLHETTLNLIQLLVEQGVLKQDAADAMLAKAKQQAAEKVAQQQAAETQAEKGVVRVTYVPETVKREIREQVRQEVVAQAKLERWGDVNAVPEWLDRLKWEGDIRVRYQGDFFAGSNAPESAFQAIGQDIDNTLEDRHRERLRLRLGLNANVGPGIDAGVRLTTGNTSDPVSTNQTLGNTGNKYTVVLDRAFLKLRPIDDLTLWGGRLPNPFFSTDLVWDDDLNFEGAAASYAPGALDPQRIVKPFFTAGVFPLQEIEENASTQAKDKWLFGAQAGVEWVPSTRMRLKVGAAYYQYENIAATLNPVPSAGLLGDEISPQSRQKGNSLFVFDSDANNDATTGDNLFGLASDFRVGALSVVADFADFYPIHVIASFDWAHNFGFDQGDILTRTGQSLDEEVDGYQARLTIGHPKFTYLEDNEWQAFVGYRYLERDAVLDAFTDSDFHLGGTNHKGYFIGGSYALMKNTWLTAKWMSSDEISGLPLSIDVFQLDLNAKF
ncbi:MAG: outer membrane receptor for ferric coprogen and ferric-rhodotorulic acid [Hydrogenophilales bacterium 16-64-46]|nr:MAG: outer membrane receptor for ferric coprogen and ferric-rhodotorulic acid [Hydrogenophilales bacterium 12-64-13]OYZ04801.1 MAG: outer membrane receptor for ferric coprogen and ferric-rhodotorulic acid [Hydrogenophilales bacterium 16-64-46]OZA38580.1 MAG: outer membrane receptor for ferric coprogen and ferric-rhodotorulic acid [Hydrogenophilales bacterium 17-64-34]